MSNAFDIDPSKMDPKLLMELSRLIQQLPPDQISRMQTIMHNQMAGFDVRKELEEFERTLPPGFRDKLMKLMMQGGAPVAEAPAAEESPAPQAPSSEMSVREARLTILRGVAEHRLTPDEAEKLLFKE